MKHRRGPFSEDLRAALNPNSSGSHLLAEAMKARREGIMWRARELGTGEDEITALLRDGVEAAERRIFGDAGKGRWRPRCATVCRTIGISASGYPTPRPSPASRRSAGGAIGGESWTGGDS
jgi:hypothetical protein